MLKKHFFLFKKNKIITENFLIFLSFFIIALIVHALVLKFVFPGYYSPLIPMHSDYYMPAALANTLGATYIGFFGSPRPITYAFSRIIGYCGIYGSIACIIVLVCVNISLSVFFIKRIFNIPFNLFFIIVFICYCYLLFSHSYFYIFYAQDIGAHLCYFFLFIGVYFYYILFNKHGILSGFILFLCCVLSFLSKETYALSALVFAFAWFIHYKKISLLNGSLPFIIIILAIGVMLMYNVHIHSTFVDLNASKGTAYQISFDPLKILQEWFRYFKESYNIANILMVLLIIVLLLKSQTENKKELIFVTLACIVAAFVAMLPNALLLNHHFEGYSFNGSPLFYLALFFIPILKIKKDKNKFNLSYLIVVLGFISPMLNWFNYKQCDWSLGQENTQKNMLKALDVLIKDLKPSANPIKILVQGIIYPFCPFHYPQSLRVFPNAKYATFDVVSANASDKPRVDLVKFIMPADTALNKYEQQWVFDNEGKLLSQMWAEKEIVFSNYSIRNISKKIESANFSKFITSGFYDQENGIRWTNGNASILLDSVISNADSIVVALTAFLPPICKKIVPKLELLEFDNKAYKPFITIKKGDVFYYLFKVNKKINIKKIQILSEKIDSRPDIRSLSFPFISLEIKY